MTELRCHQCGSLLAKDNSGITEVKRSGLEMRAHGIEAVSIKCPRCFQVTETVFTRSSGELKEIIK